MVAAVALSKYPMWAFALGGLLFVGGVILLWYGRDLKRAVLPGLAAGLLVVLSIQMIVFG